MAPATVPLLVDAIVLGLNSADPSTRLVCIAFIFLLIRSICFVSFCASTVLTPSAQSATTLAYNTSLYLVCNESEALAQLVSAIVALLNEPSLKPEDETSFLLLVALGHFMYAHTHTYTHMRNTGHTVIHSLLTILFVAQVLQRHGR